MYKKAIILVCFAGTLISSCSLIEIDVSDKRIPTPRIILLNKHIEVSPTGITRISKSDFFPSSFRIKENGKLIYIDPLAVDIPDLADYILITHAHLDHFSIKDIKKISKAETLIICPIRVARKLRDYKYKIREVKPGDSFCLDNKLKVEAVAAYNLKSAFLWLKAHPKSKQNVGYVFNIDTVRIYHTGDTDYIPEMENIRDIDLTLVPIGGDNLTMNVEDAARLINQIKPQIALPMHYDIKERSNVDRFMNLIDKSIEVRVLE
jgi:L-ascorbate metabolism protein UlaG (beta-lactamase superfamily)